MCAALLGRGAVLRSRIAGSGGKQHYMRVLRACLSLKMSSTRSGPCASRVCMQPRKHIARCHGGTPRGVLRWKPAQIENCTVEQLWSRQDRQLCGAAFYDLRDAYITCRGERELEANLVVSLAARTARSAVSLARRYISHWDLLSTQDSLLIWGRAGCMAFDGQQFPRCDQSNH